MYNNPLNCLLTSIIQEFAHDIKQFYSKQMALVKQFMAIRACLEFSVSPKMYYQVIPFFQMCLNVLAVTLNK